MFGMGLTLHLSDFSYVLQMPRLIFAGIVLQYTIMPLTAVVLSNTMGLDPVLTAGMILVGTCPGGTASNVICYLARGNVALSITLTAISTLLAVILTPALTAELVSKSINVPALDMLLSIFFMVIIPVSAGVLVNHVAALAGIGRPFEMTDLPGEMAYIPRNGRARCVDDGEVDADGGDGDSAGCGYRGVCAAGLVAGPGGRTGGAKGWQLFHLGRSG